MIKLYWNIGSQPARAVKALLDIGKIKHETIVLDLRKNETRSVQFLKLNPLGQIPFVITENGLGIGESNAIMQYLCQKYPQKLGQLYNSKDIKQKTSVNVMLSWYQSYFRQVLFSRIRIKIYGTIKKGIPHTLAQLQQVDLMMGEALHHLERILTQNQYVAGKGVSIADLLVYFQLTNLIYYDMEGKLKELPKVSQWYQNIGAIPQVKAIQDKWKQTVDDFKMLLASAKAIDA